jgi:hypothetical protein
MSGCRADIVRPRLQDVDWAAHPAECIVALTTKGKYVVQRTGLPLNDYGLVDAAAAKRAAAGGNDDSAGTSSTPAPVLSEALINDFEGARKAFQKDTMSHMTARELDLGARPSASFGYDAEHYSVPAEPARRLPE